jgi:anti-sigma B factor antagonist
MDLECNETGPALVVRPREKRLDARKASEFKETLGRMIEQGHRRIVLNLATVDFVDSSGLGAIVSSLKKLGPGGDLVICEVAENVGEMFKLTRMDRVFRIFSTEAEGVRALSS